MDGSAVAADRWRARSLDDSCGRREGWSPFRILGTSDSHTCELLWRRWRPGFLRLERESVWTRRGLIGQAPLIGGECDDLRRDISQRAIGVPRHEAESRQRLLGAAGVAIGDNQLRLF